MPRPHHQGILVLDYGSQYTLLIARRLREIGVYAEVIDGMADGPPPGFTPRGIILSGGPDSVLEVGSRRLPPWVLASELPVLGICYGIHLLVEAFGGRVRAGRAREYGKSELILDGEMGPRASKMFYGLPTRQVVWMSHGDDIQDIGRGFRAVGHTEDGAIAALVHEDRPIAALQFHPEVQHSQHGGQMLEQFARDVCRLPLDWQPQAMLASTLEGIRETVGDGSVLMAVSGGVDSTVAAACLVGALGPERVTAVFVDHGLLRKNEAAWVLDNLRHAGLKKVELLERQDAFFTKLEGVSDPEEKRKIIGRTFIEEFEAFAKAHPRAFTHLGQGTLYPDVIESAGHGAGAKVIKSHHNVGGLPETLALALVEPFRFLFKDEVRRIGRELGIGELLIGRHPFPGPGLAVRILGAIDPEKVRILQDVDHVFIDSLRAEGLYDQAWQAFAVLLPVKTVGVMGDNRTYQWTAALRAVTSSDGMTAEVARLPLDFLMRVADTIVRKVDGVNRVVYDITGKPPATIEWE